MADLMNFDLSRFTDAQEGVYPRALKEIKSGQKQTHWMWFFFPQIDGLGRSSMAQCYAIKSIEEARQYLQHPVLGTRLRECAEALLSVKGLSIAEIMGYPDDLKLKSCMTLFAEVTEPDAVFMRVLNKYFEGERDMRTLQILAERKRGEHRC